MIRQYKIPDKEFLLELFRLNTPENFHPSEESGLKEYLDHHSAHYFVVEDQGKLWGSGGINFSEDGTEACLSWDIIHPQKQGKGIGKKLALFRLEEIRKRPDVARVVVRTSQMSFGFYEKLGFTLRRTEKDFWAPGFDLYDMDLVPGKGS